MNRRHYFLVPDEVTAHNIVEDLRGMGIDDADIHAVAREDKLLLDIPAADQRQTTDVNNARKLGASLGGAAGLAIGLAAIAFPPAGIIAAGGFLTVLTTTAAGATVGTLSTFLVGLGMDNEKLQPFQQAIEDGKILLLIDVDEKRVDDMENVVYSHHRDAVIESGDID